MEIDRRHFSAPGDRTTLMSGARKALAIMAASPIMIVQKAADTIRGTGTATAVAARAA